MYIALKYVNVCGRLYAPGETVAEDPNALWHIAKGAIRPVYERPDTEPEQKREAPEAAYETEPEPEEDVEEEDTEPEIPEIDITDAIVPQKPKTARKGSAK